MTRVLSELLHATEPLFSQSVQQLERLAGHPRSDIRLATTMQSDLRAKLTELGLDSKDTTGRELYAALGQRLHADNQRFETNIRGSAPATDDSAVHIARVLTQYVRPLTSFAVRSSTAKRLLKANLPRRTMKALGYRSADSMLKHETAASLYAAAWLVESPQWAKRMVGGFSKLQANDFESRDIALEHPSSQRWHDLAETVVAVQKNHVLTFKELGAVVIVPLPASKPHFAALATTVLVLHAINEVRAAGTFLKLHQMQPEFGKRVQEVILGEPVLPAVNLDTPVLWHSLHQYFDRLTNTARADIFEPLVSRQELAWTSVERVLARIEPTLEFWHGTSHLGMLHDGRPVSCNLTDTLLSHSNGFRFDQRIVQYFQQSLRAELLLGYLRSDKLEETVFSNIHSQLAPALAVD